VPAAATNEDAPVELLRERRIFGVALAGARSAPPRNLIVDLALHRQCRADETDASRAPHQT